MISYFQAIVIGLFQGVTELVPISSLGHSVLLPELFGWHHLVRAESTNESFYLAFLVALHVATTLALLVHFRSTWSRIIRGLFTSSRKRRIETADERLAWLLVVGTIPVGITGLALEHFLRTVFAKPAAAASFLIVNGFILLIGERLRARTPLRTPPVGAIEPPGRRLDSVAAPRGRHHRPRSDALALCRHQSLGHHDGRRTRRGLNHEDAARFSFLLATPVIFAAGVYKIPDLAGPLGNGVRGQALAGGAAFAAAYVAVRFLERYFERRTLVPFAVYCFGFGAFSLLYLAL